MRTSHPRQWVCRRKQCLLGRRPRGTVVETWLVPGGPRRMGGDDTPVVESEGNRSSMRQMVSDGWALDTVPAGLVQTAHETPVVESEGKRSMDHGSWIMTYRS